MSKVYVFSIIAAWNVSFCMLEGGLTCALIRRSAEGSPGGSHRPNMRLIIVLLLLLVSSGNST